MTPLARARCGPAGDAALRARTTDVGPEPVRATPPFRRADSRQARLEEETEWPPAHAQSTHTYSSVPQAPLLQGVACPKPPPEGGCFAIAKTIRVTPQRRPKRCGKHGEKPGRPCEGSHNRLAEIIDGYLKTAVASLNRAVDAWLLNLPWLSGRENPRPSKTHGRVRLCL